MRTSPVMILLACLALTAVLGCSTIKVTTDYNREFDFSGFKTFSWMAGKPAVLRDPLVDTAILERRVKQAVESELRLKGYVKAEQNPDFFLSYHFGTESQVDVSSCGYHYPVSRILDKFPPQS